MFFLNGSIRDIPSTLLLGLRIISVSTLRSFNTLERKASNV